MSIKFDLVERLELFGKNCIKFAKEFPRNIITLPLISQFIRSGTSVGANYCEATHSESKSDYLHKASIARKEAKETCFWLKMLVEAAPQTKEQAELLYQESYEISLILSSIVTKLKRAQT